MVTAAIFAIQWIEPIRLLILDFLNCHQSWCHQTKAFRESGLFGYSLKSPYVYRPH